MGPHIMSHGMDASSKDLRSHIVAFFSSPWWFRIWTVQEFCLAADVVFQCGSRTLASSIIWQWGAHYIGHATTCCRRFAHFRGPAGDGPFDVTALSVVSSIERLFVLEELRLHFAKRSLVAVMLDFGLRQCQDPRDKFYGLLGLVNYEERSLIRPDYVKPTIDVYLDVFLAVTRSSNSLGMLSCKVGSGTSSLNVPSFVPDWVAFRTERNLTMLRMRLRDAHPFYRASKYSAVDLYSAADEVILSGVQVDRIDQIVEFHSGEPWSAWSAMLRRAQTLTVTSDAAKSVYDDRETAFWKLLCGDLVQDGFTGDGWRFVDDVDISKFHSWWAWMESDGSVITNANVSSFDVAFRVVSDTRIIAVTEQGYIGWVPLDSQAGDSVVLLAGGRVPYIIRPTEPSADVDNKSSGTTPEDKRTRPAYTFVGDSYIQGIMQGECWDEEKLESFRLV